MSPTTSLAEIITEFIKRNAEPRIISRGKNYFRAGEVTDHCEEPSSLTHEFTVRGTELYQVSFILNQDRAEPITGAFCTCPYSGWGLCKHIVASMLWLNKQYTETTVPTSAPTKAKEVKLLEAAPPPKRKKRSAGQPYTIENYNRLTDEEYRDIHGNLGVLPYLHSAGFNYAGEDIFTAKVKLDTTYDRKSQAKTVTLETRENDLVVTCSCEGKVEKLCSHAYRMVEHLLLTNALKNLRKPTENKQEAMAVSAMKKNGLNPDEDWTKYLELRFVDFKWKMDLNNTYANLIYPERLNEDDIKNVFRSESGSAFPKTRYGDSDEPYQVGFTIGFTPHHDEILINAVVAKEDKNGNPMRQGFSDLRSSRHYKHILTTPHDQPLLALSELLSERRYWDNPFLVNVVDQIRLNKDRLENHPYLFYHRAPHVRNLRKSDLTPIRFVSHSPKVVYHPRELDEFIHLDVYIVQNGEKVMLSDREVDLVHPQFVKAKDILYFLDSERDGRHFEAAVKLCGRTMLTARFPAFFQKYLRYALETNMIETEDLHSFSLSEGRLKADSKEIYLSENGMSVLFKPFIRCEGDVLINTLTEESTWEMDGNTLMRKDRDEAAIEAFNELLADVFPQIEYRQVEDYLYLSYQELQKDNLIGKIFERLTEEGVTIFGFRELKGLRISPYPAKVSYRVSSQIDWFEVEMEMAWGDMTISLEELKKRFVPGNDYIELGNGSRGMIPDEWIKKLERLFRHGKFDVDKLQISNKKFSLVDELFEEIEDADALEFIKDRKAKLLNVELQQDLPLPKGIKAALRHYQKDGYRWMSFLDALGWGGILADDMGLGKTLQVIVMLKKVLDENKQTNLIVVPTSLLFNWENELKKFAPTLKAHFHYGPDRAKTIDHFGKHQTILTSYGTMLSDILLLKEFAFNYVILDESQAIKNPASKRYKAARLLKANNRLAMTGTPIENNTFDLYAQMSFLNPGLLGSAKAFKDQYARPIDTDRDSEKAAELQRLIKPFVLRRTKEQVATELPDKTEEILYCEMGKAQRKVYDAHRNKYREMLSKKLEEEGAQKMRFAVLEGLTKLRQICDSPQLLPGEEKYEGEAEKINLLLMHIKEKTANHKILVFSQFVKMLKIIEGRLQEEGIEYAYLDGQSNTKQRQANVDHFQNEENCRVFLISLKAGGTGLNLMAADYVYIVDPWWNPAVENQAIDRCYRIGQDKKVIAYRLICKDTVEEKIMVLQEKKKSIAGEIITTDEGVMKKMSKDDLLGLFE